MKAERRKVRFSAQRCSLSAMIFGAPRGFDDLFRGVANCGSYGDGVDGARTGIILIKLCQDGITVTLHLIHRCSQLQPAPISELSAAST
jgi:hypothetical protein